MGCHKLSITQLISIVVLAIRCNSLSYKLNLEHIKNMVQFKKSENSEE